MIFCEQQKRDTYIVRKKRHIYFVRNRKKTHGVICENEKEIDSHILCKKVSEVNNLLGVQQPPENFLHFFLDLKVIQVI